MYTMQVTADGKSLVDINQLLTGMTFMRPMDFEFGPDGALYLIEWGTGFGGNNDDSGVYRIDYIAGDRAPIAVAARHADLRAGAADRAVLQRRLPRPGRAGRSPTPGRSATAAPRPRPNPSHTYTGAGNYTAQLTVTDPGGRTAVANVPITVGNTAPTVDHRRSRRTAASSTGATRSPTRSR